MITEWHAITPYFLLPGTWLAPILKANATYRNTPRACFMKCTLHLRMFFPDVPIFV